MAFSVFVLFLLFNVFNCRSTNRCIFELGLFNTRAITASFVISATLLFFFVQGAYLSIPLVGIEIGELLDVIPLETNDWLIVFATASTVFFFDEVRKLIQRASNRSARR